MSQQTQEQYDSLFRRLDALCQGESDAVALMATIACELKLAFGAFHWVGFYRAAGNELLKIGPYQGGHGCLTIPFSRGVCGRCAREMRMINVPDVNSVPDHIACSVTTRSELVLPITDGDGRLLAVLDIDSDTPEAFGLVDESNLPTLNKYFAAQSEKDEP
jgi:L-methionine (R)-S-oxide reductase